MMRLQTDPIVNKKLGDKELQAVEYRLSFEKLPEEKKKGRKKQITVCFLYIRGVSREKVEEKGQ